MPPDIDHALAAHRAGQLAEAEAHYRALLEKQPRDPAALHLLGVLLIQTGRHDAADRHLAEAAAHFPAHAAIQVLRGAVLLELGRAAEALTSFDAALTLAPRDVVARGGRGDALMALHRAEEAIGEYERMAALEPGDPSAWQRCGEAQMQIRRTAPALASFGRAIALKPDYFEALVRRGNLYLMDKRFTEAVADYDRALRVQPDSAGTLYNRGTALKELKRHAEALADYERALALDPGLPHLEGAALHARMQMCDWRGWEPAQDAVLANLSRRSAMPFVILSLPSTPAQQKFCATLYTGAKHPPDPRPLWTGERYDHDRIRLAYLCGAFTDHPVAHVTADVFAWHDRSRFELFALSYAPDDGGAMRKRLIPLFDRFLDVSDKDDQFAAQLLRELQIDIAVDLDGLTEVSRPGVIARRPAPVQVNWLGFPATIGATYADYIIADRIIAPDAAHFSEKLAWLPETFFPAEALAPLATAPSRASCGLPERGLVFCAFNNTYKITPDVFGVWMRLLAAIPDSVLWLREVNYAVRAHLEHEAAARGIAPSRLVFAQMVQSRQDHIARQRLGDIFLDTLYYNAHSTACDALRAGMPLVTWKGPAYAGRVAASLLHAVGMDDLVADSLEHYEAIALALARDPARLHETRARLRSHLRTHPLFDVPRFTRHLEQAYATMHARAAQGLAPENFNVEALPPAPL